MTRPINCRGARAVRSIVRPAFRMQARTAVHNSYLCAKRVQRSHGNVAGWGGATQAQCSCRNIEVVWREERGQCSCGEQPGRSRYLVGLVAGGVTVIRERGGGDPRRGWAA